MLLFFDLGTGEILLILLVLFVVVGPRQLPEVARTVGKAINEMKRASAGFRNEIQKEAMRLERESGISEIRKPLNDLNVNVSDTPVKPVDDPNKNKDLNVDELGVIPFGSAHASQSDQIDHEANKT